MNEGARANSNPLIRLAGSAPPRLGRALTLGGRFAGAALALWIAGGESFARTRALALVVVVVALLSLLPLPRLAPRLMWLGAGVLFFSGALLAHLPAGLLMLAAGALAAAGAALDDHHHGRPPGVPSFFTAFGLTVAAVVAIILTIE